MTTEKRKIYLISVIIPVILVPILFVPTGLCRLVAALALAAATVTVMLLLKKRSIPSINYRSVAGIVAVIAVVFWMLVYLSGIWLGFEKNPTPLSLESLWRVILPTVVIIVSTELLRHTLLSQERKAASVSAFIVGVLAELLIFGGICDVGKISQFVDIIGLALFPALTANFLYNYLVKRYGAAPSIAFHLLMALPLSLLPIVPALPNAIKAFLMLLIPLLSLTFIDLLYEKKVKYALAKKTKGSYISMGAMILCMLAVIMLVSGLFRYKVIIIATPSMTGELNEGDAIVYEEYDGQIVKKGDIIVFTKDSTNLIVHRVVDAEQIDGTVYYTTKGDANDSSDSGFITAENIQGVVLFKIPFIGTPNLWLRDALDQK